MSQHLFFSPPSSPPLLLPLFSHPHIQPDAEEARKAFNDLEKSVRDKKKEITDLEKLIALNTGNDGEFVELQEKCFSMKQNKYTYEICPFDKASQKESSSTSLGTFESLDLEKKVMKFTNGAKCWNGPKRSIEVRFECGSENTVLSIDEPSTCVYVAKMSTPAVCDENHALALRMSLLGVDLEEEE